MKTPKTEESMKTLTSDEMKLVAGGFGFAIPPIMLSPFLVLLEAEFLRRA